MAENWSPRWLNKGVRWLQVYFTVNVSLMWEENFDTEAGVSLTERGVRLIWGPLNKGWRRCFCNMSFLQVEVLILRKPN